MKRPLRIATCQFSVEADIAHNRDAVLAQIEEAARREARVVHFSEAALSGYAGVDFDDIAELDWELLKSATEAICRLAKEKKAWVLLGSTHRLSDGRRPHNSIYVIDDRGQIVERYDKRFCTGTLDPAPNLDLAHYSPGNHTTVFEVDGYQCGVLICYDYRFPELYRDLKQRDVEILFQSFHNARRDEESHDRDNIWIEIVPATMMCRAATNHFWISANNSTARYSSWPSFFVVPNGRITGRLPEHESAVLISEVDPAGDYWDASGPWRERSIAGRLHSGELVEDPRSADRTCL